MQKFLLVLLVLAAGFAVSGVSAVVLAQVKEKNLDELTFVSSKEERREVRLVVVGLEETSNDDFKKAKVEETEEETKVDEKNEPKRKKVSKISDEELEVVIEQLEYDDVSVSDTDEESSKIKNRSNDTSGKVRKVPFYSQFADITPVNWRKVGCGIASTAMLIDYYSDEVVSVDALLQQGIAAGSFLSDAGWTHQGLINLTKQFGMNGESRSLTGLTMTEAFDKLEEVVSEGPVMVSVHYTFEPTNPIPHLVVVNGVKDGKVFYNDPAETSGGGSLSIEKFKSAWKKRYISIRPQG